MENKTRKKIYWNFVLLMIAISSISIRLMMQYQFDKSAMLYIGVPFLIAMALLWIDRADAKGNWKRKFLNLMLVSLIIMLGSSIVLFEGFVCVVMFMPIYFGIILLVFIIRLISESLKNRKKSQLLSHIMPVFLFMSAFEGTHPNLTFDRQNQVTVTRVVNLSPAELRNNLLRPVQLQKDRPWFLELFPMPYRITANSLEVGDIHEVFFRYHRWFVTNTHEGSMRLQIQSSQQNVVKSKFISDSSYIATYLKLNLIELTLEPMGVNQTRVSMTISFERMLDPAWYFDPLQNYGISKSAEFLISEMVVKSDE